MITIFFIIVKFSESDRRGIEQAVVELNEQGIYPSESNVSNLMSQPGYLREKEVRAALKKARQKLGIKR